MHPFDIKKVQFSRYGSYMSIGHCGAWQDRPEGLCLRSIRNSMQRETFFISLIKNGKPVPFKTTVTPVLMTLEAPECKVEFCYPTHDRLHFKVSGCSLSLWYIGGTYGRSFPKGKRQWTLNCGNNWTQYRFTSTRGTLENQTDPLWLSPWKMTAIFSPDSQTGIGEGVIEDFQRNAPPASRFGSFHSSAKKVSQEFKSWCDEFEPAPEGLEKARELALYVNWSAVVAPSGLLKRPGMLMSKNWMTNIWSWDHAFNAMALAKAHPELAWDQFMIPFDHQDSSGLIPDFVNEQTSYWNYTKPPIHGWALNWMLDRGFKLTKPMLVDVYAKLSAWTNWWLITRNYDGDGFPQAHDGDDGWDNGTCYQVFPPYRGPAIAAYLVLQLELLARLARMLKHSKDAKRHEQQGEKLFQCLLKTAWVKDRFVTRRGETHEYMVESDCLINMLPIVLGKRLPDKQRKAIIAALKQPGRFLTENGLATESVSSSKYESDGYWRGPIWAPPTMLAIDGLHRAGEEEFARDLAARFCRMCARSGFAENFDAVSGAGLRDPAYTWTSSVFLILSSLYLKDGNA